MHFSMEAKERYAPLVRVFTPVSLFVSGDDHSSSLSIFTCPPRTPGHLIHTSESKNSFLIQV